MAEAFNAAIVLENLADDASVTASSQVDDLPARNLVTSPHVTDDRWRSTSNADYVVFAAADGGPLVNFDTAAALGLTLGAAGTIRCRVSSVDPTGAAGDLFDSGVLSDGDDAAFAQAYGAAIFQLDAVVSGYVRFDLADAAASYVEMGKPVIGERTQFAINFAPGATFDWTDLSAQRRARGGQVQVFDQPSFRTAALTFEWISNAERWGVVETLGKTVGRHKPVLLILDPTADNLPQWSIYGLLADQTPAAFSAFPDMHQKQLRIEERL